MVRHNQTDDCIDDRNEYNAEDLHILPTSVEITLDTNGKATFTGTGPIQVYTVDTFGDAASDDWEDSAGLIANTIYIMRIANAARAVTVKHGGNHHLLQGVDYPMTGVAMIFEFYSPDGTVLYERSRSPNS